MAVYPTIGGSDGTWGTEKETWDLAGHNADGTNKLQYDVNGTPTTVFTKFLTGTLDSDSSTNVAHGVSNGISKIISMSILITRSSGAAVRTVEWYQTLVAAEGCAVQFDNTNIVFGSVGTSLQGEDYRVRIDHIA